MDGLAQLTGAVADVVDMGGSIGVVTAGIAEAMTAALQRQDLLPLFEGKQKSFAAFVDPQRHFIVHCSVHQPGHLTEAHDHGEAWAVYGVVHGRSRYRRFSRGDDLDRGRASLVCERDEQLGVGQVDVVQPGQVHVIGNETDELAWNVVVRPRPIEEVWRRRYDLGTGGYVIHPNSLPK